MKSNVKNVSDKISRNNNRPVLSIGLIVKNEEKYLDKCLGALKPICDAVSSEIIVVDTGSNDSTVEIAKKYTDKVYYFEWIDDFSAARNYGLERASGEWFMFIDADEIFDEDVNEFVKFFNSGRYKSYNSACIHLRNYTDEEFKIYNESIPTRLAKRTDKLKFINKIHECLSFGEPENECDIRTFADHYGYVGSKVNDAKLERNKALLMKDFENDPTDALTISYLHFTAKDFDEKEKYLKMWLELAEKKKPSSMPEYCYLTCTQFYFKEKLFKEAIKYAKKYLDIDGVFDEMSTISVLIHIADAYYCLNEYEKTKKYLKKYFEFYEKYEAGKLMYRLKTMLMGIQSFEAEQQKYVLADCCAKTGDLEKACKVLENASFEKVSPNALQQCSKVFADVYAKKCDVLKLVKSYEILFALDKETATSFLSECCWRLFETDGKNEFLKCISDTSAQTMDGMMCEVLLSEGKTGYSELVQTYVNMLPNFKPAYSPIVAASLSAGCNLQKALENVSRTEMLDMRKTLFDNLGKERYAEMVVPFVGGYEVETLSELYFMIELLDPIKAMSTEIYYSFAMLYANYVTNVYSEEVLNDADVGVLPAADRFGYYVYKADAALQSEDKVGCVRALRKALKICPEFKDVVLMLTEDLQEE